MSRCNFLAYLFFMVDRGHGTLGHLAIQLDISSLFFFGDDKIVLLLTTSCLTKLWTAALLLSAELSSF